MTDAEYAEPTGTGPLAGVLVLDASQMLAGPVCAMRLGDLGARVIKIEPPGRGEANREAALGGVRIGGETTTFLALNRNKESLTLNLKTGAGQRLFGQLVEKADVVIQNFRLGTAERLGIAWEQISPLNPRLVYCSISGFGRSGPYRDRPGQDLVIQGYSGSMWAAGSASDPPLPSPIWAMDVLTGYQAAIGVLAALIGRGTTGRGQHVEVDMFSVALDAQLQELVTFLNAGVAPTRRAEPTAHALIPPPYGVFATQDGFVTLAMTPLEQLAAALGDPELEQIARLEVEDIDPDLVQGIVAKSLRERPTSVWLDVATRHNLWLGPVLHYQDLLSDPHVKETGMLALVTHPSAGELSMPAIPIHLSATEASIRTPPPLLGQHTEVILRDDLGVDVAAIHELERAGVI